MPTTPTTLPDPPTTTGTSSFNPTIVELFEEAYERAGAEMRSGYDFRTARRSLNLLTIEWATRGLNLWTIEQGSIALNEGVATYSLPTDTVDVIETVLRTEVPSVFDANLQRVSVLTYAAIPNKSVLARPTQVYIQRRTGITDGGTGTIQYPSVTLWPVPDKSVTYNLIYWRMRRMQDAGNAQHVSDIPFRMLPALVAGLAYYIAMKLPGADARLQMLKAEYDRQWELGSGEDRERATLRIVPRISS